MRKIIYTIRITGILTSLLFAFQFSFAQQGIVTGLVKDMNGTPLPGASVTVEGKKIGTATDINGHYILKLSPGEYTIVVTFIGQSTQQEKIIVKAGTTQKHNLTTKEVYNQSNAIVVGSRSRNARTKLNTPVPVDVISIAKIAKEVAQVDLNQLLNYTVPSFQSARQAISDGTDHLDPAQLRGLGSDQVLILINGKRRHQAALVNVNGTVNRGQVGTDFSAIPVSSVERIEVLRDGAAAQYGSDAIAGVINIILKKNINSLGGSISFGENITSYTKDYAFEKLGNTSVKDISVHDGGTFQAGLNYGFGIGKKGFINLSGEYSLRDKSNRTGTYTGQVFPSVNGANKDDSILSARSLTRNDFDMRIGNSKISSGAVVLNAEYAFSSNWNLKLFGGFNQ